MRADRTQPAVAAAVRWSAVAADGAALSRPRRGPRADPKDRVARANRSASPRDVAVATGLGSLTSDGTVVFNAPRTSGAPSPLRKEAPPVTPGSPSPRPAGDSVPDVLEMGQTSTNDTPTDLATLSEALYERIEQRLRNDLLHERERLGCLPDF